ncbi:MAG: ATP-binding cassette domain-containing protein [Chitinophagaceae bacterium]|nr:MAG: ATP-binding cassette domain-containing protein [Chitinophagaceae bacterium]
MKIELENIAKKFKKEWIFKDISFDFHINNSYAITGPNGSGKSTLMKIISSAVTPSSGKVFYSSSNKPSIPDKEIYKEIAFCAPYMALISEFTLLEMLEFQEKIIPYQQNLNSKQIISDILKFEKHQNKQLRYFSSGMLQRVKLILSVLAEKSILLLDEPATNLDESGLNWYHQLINDFSKEKIVIVASNQKREYTFCTDELNLLKYKS